MKRHVLKNWVWFGFFISSFLIGDFEWANWFFTICVFYCVTDQKSIDQEEKDDAEYYAEIEAAHGIDFELIRK